MLPTQRVAKNILINISCIGKSKTIKQQCPVHHSQNVLVMFLEGFSTNCKRQLGLKVLKSHLESGDFNQVVIDAHLPPLQNILSQYSTQSTFSLCEYQRQYQMATGTTITSIPSPNVKSSRKRGIQFLSVVMQVVQRSLSSCLLYMQGLHCPFNKIPEHEYGLDYNFTKKHR